MQAIVETQCQVEGFIEDDLATTCIEESNTQMICEMDTLDMNEQ